MPVLSQQPYLLRALYEWCVNAGYTPYLTLRADAQAQIPPGYARNGEITLNVHPESVQGLDITDDWLSFSARFGGVAQRVEAPVANVLAIYARETGEGMSFAVPDAMGSDADNDQDGVLDSAPVSNPAQGEAVKPSRGKPSLHIVK